MSKRVYTLKRATPRMKYQHMRNMLEFKADLKDKQENPPDRHVALDFIHEQMGGGFHAWYDAVYKLRDEGKQEEYERVIFEKAEELQREIPAETSKVFNWKEVSPNTMKAYALAITDFETVTSLRVDRADAESLAAWDASMRGRKLSVNTRRARLSAVRVVSGVEFPLPKKVNSERRLLSAEQVRALMAQVKSGQDRTSLVKELTAPLSRAGLDMSREEHRGTTRPPMQFEENLLAHFDRLSTAHFVGRQTLTPSPSPWKGEGELTTQDLTRRIKRYARKAGINEKQVNLRVWRMSGQRLLGTLSRAEFMRFMETLTPALSLQGEGAVEWKRLHGIGRRGGSLVKV
jgi:hypothetical protein